MSHVTLLGEYRVIPGPALEDFYGGSFESGPDRSASEQSRSNMWFMTLSETAKLERVLLNNLLQMSNMQPQSDQSQSLLNRVFDARDQGKLIPDIRQPEWSCLRAFFPPKSGRCCFDDLSNEIMQMICGYACLQYYPDIRGAAIRRCAYAISSVSKLFNKKIQPSLYQTLSLTTPQNVIELVHIIRASPHISTYIQRLLISIKLNGTMTARFVGPYISELLEKCTALKYLMLTVSSTSGPAFTYSPWLTSKASSPNLTELRISSPVLFTPVMRFLTHFSNLTKLCLYKTNLAKMVHDPSQLKLKLQNVLRLELDHVLLGQLAIDMFARSLPALDDLYLYEIPSGVMELLDAFFTNDVPIRILSVSRCNSVPYPFSLRLEYWQLLESICIDSSFIMSAKLFPLPKTVDYKSLPNLRQVQIVANLTVPCPEADMISLIDTMRMFQNMLPREQIYDEDTGSTVTICPVDVLIMIPAGNFRAMFGATYSTPVSVTPRNLLSQTYVLMQSSGTTERPEVDLISVADVARLFADVCYEWDINVQGDAEQPF
ncbi:hypothetical protein V1512DRAFT_259528 [Lipomyces arxii]|uniref:uncharacterized protein n=1 Tax=Lipomyces arxii TaxID=56418 RepID=UPI0034CD0827